MDEGVVQWVPAARAQADVAHARCPVYTFDQDMNMLEKRYIGDPAVIEAKVDQVANQGKAK